MISHMYNQMIMQTVERNYPQEKLRMTVVDSWPNENQ